ncbi:bifunctional 2-keto-4-hydroxyglutarate aldolase/2-keto-3-deoxy-6-phosphogluconate aldolase [Streptococcus gallolyticus subsp. gallolyticus]|uniref:bifunctional 2-keto-4-hydroxyglutarate aldolase/2-keto-3-deoxy-6-phosphogluconate aldolase n=1 Tax=Streptococcus gallolyticus TaxID=315405 RepID=UPI0022833EC0|nr:bifunctional 2-keto-4-hydroxyglutarate aldolase/2-keto-3-deoxy-6-phosphogluconate aldolase [Streptococcus gallolyticus]MCY7171195.1 bifunctional 2-keto-4-hydroxyglutarate aldolase/2-keto-3-deoxy-6-phosphogluconate aldolase [Streptococcus gallolyticus subsp. gallolyticus]
MKKIDVLNRLYEEKLMGIIRVTTFERAKEIAESCLAGGVSCLEISYTNFNAGDIIQQLKEKYNNRLLVGAGTVLDSETAREAIFNGAEFIIAPTFKEEVAKICNRYQIAYMPGCMTMTEVVEALEAGASMVKAFPSSSLYGPNIISTIKTPMPYVPILSSGGVTLNNVNEWLKQGVDCMGIGSLLSKGTAQEIEQNARALREAVNKSKELL